MSDWVNTWLTVAKFQELVSHADCRRCRQLCAREESEVFWRSMGGQRSAKERQLSGTEADQSLEFSRQ